MSGQEEQRESDHRVLADRVPEGVWVVDPDGSQVNIRARSIFGLVPVNGFFEGFEGELRADADGAARGTLSVRAGSIRTGIDARDERLRSAEFFDAAEYPLITFVLDRITRSVTPEMRISDEDRMTVEGRLRVRDTVVPLSFPATLIAHGDHLHVECKVRIDHHAAGLGWTRPGLVGKRARADVALTLVQPADGGP